MDKFIDCKEGSNITIVTKSGITLTGTLLEKIRNLEFDESATRQGGLFQEDLFLILLLLLLLFDLDLPNGQKIPKGTTIAINASDISIIAPCTTCV